MLRSEIGPTVPLVPFTAGSWVAIWDTCPAPQPLSATAAASPHAASPAVRAKVRDMKRSIEASCSPTKRPDWRSW
jgi:hypothetical protein